jgi:uncharacterized 2Fe-2S/4Fe-4S cluster protein (DUF4445 family)
MADRLLLSNDTVTAPQGQGTVWDEDTLFVPLLINEASVHGTAAQTLAVAAGPMPHNGRVVDFAIGVARVAVSASGFVSANVSANLRINSVSCLTTLPAIIGPVGSAGQAVVMQTNLCSANGVSAVVNKNSANFSAGDRLAIDWTAQSAGSAAAGQTGTGQSPLCSVIKSLIDLTNLLSYCILSVAS